MGRQFCRANNSVILIFQNVEVEEEHVDERSVDDLLSFINGGNGGIYKKHSSFLIASLTVFPRHQAFNSLLVELT